VTRCGAFTGVVCVDQCAFRNVELDAVDGEPGVGFFKPAAKAGATLRLGRKILLKSETGLSSEN
jgi:hypothetical protein